VPMLVISPWSKGGWVSSEVFDHTSLIRFIERRFSGVFESNITKWRRAVAGDLTSTLDFKSPSPGKIKLPNTSAYVPTDSERHDDYKPTPPTTNSVPAQEPGVRPARAVPYDLTVASNIDAASKKLTLKFSNSGKAAAVLQVRSGDGSSGPWTYTVGASDSVSDSWDLSRGSYDLTVYGPNGFMRAFKGTLSRKDKANLSVNVQFNRDGSVVALNIRNEGSAASSVTVKEAYSTKQLTRSLKPSDHMNAQFDLDASYGWYDCAITVDQDASFAQRLAGHAECGRDSMSDPLLGKAGSA
jgi:phospholipase C